MDNLRQFVAQFLAGELEPYIKSEPLPEDNSGPVTVSHTHQLPHTQQEVSCAGCGGQEL